MDTFQIIATVSLVIQLVVLGLLFGAVWLKNMKKFRQHGITMLSAVVLHAILILTWMIPSFTGFFSDPGSINLADTIAIIILVHAFAGIIAFVLGALESGFEDMLREKEHYASHNSVVANSADFWYYSIPESHPAILKNSNLQPFFILNAEFWVIAILRC